MLYLVYDSWHRHSVFTPVLSIYTDTWHVTLDIWFMTPALGITLILGICTGTWYLKPVPRYSIFRHGTWYMSYLTPDPDTRYVTSFIWYKYIDLTSWPLTGHYHPWYLYYMTYSRLSLLWGLGMTIILLPDIWYSWTPVHLYTWTPEIGRLLTLLMILYSCWPP